jgi:CIC family chloride channel protein
VAYAISGEASVSGDQRLHEGVKIHELQHIPVEEIMQTPVVSVDASNNLQEFSSLVAASHRHHSYPVFDQGKLVGTVSIWALASVNREDWPVMYRKPCEFLWGHGSNTSSWSSRRAPNSWGLSPKPTS